MFEDGCLDFACATVSSYTSDHLRIRTGQIIPFLRAERSPEVSTCSLRISDYGLSGLSRRPYIFGVTAHIVEQVRAVPL